MAMRFIGISLFKTSQTVRGFSTSCYVKAAIQNVVVIGSGLMGSGIAQVAAQNGQNVVLVDVNEKALKKAEKSINSSLQRVAKAQFKADVAKAEKFVSDAAKRISYSADGPASVKSCNLVVEAIIENLNMKQKLFTDLDAAAPSGTIFASNTSSLSIAEIADSTKRKDRFIGLHFFNPVPVMKLLEVIRIPETSDDTYRKVMDWGNNIGKHTVTCRDTPGFIVNRLLVPYLLEGIRMLERGDASARDIDMAMKLGTGYPMGPIELTDYAGLDTMKFVAEGWSQKFPDNPQFKVPPSLKRLVDEGKFGVKSGEGYYKYDKK